RVRGGGRPRRRRGPRRQRRDPAGRAGGVDLMTFTPPPVTVPGATAGRTLSGGVPGGDPATAWGRRRDSYRLVSPGNRPRFHVIVVGTGLAGSGAAAALAELGFRVTVFTYHDAPRRAHSVAAQGGI